MLCFFFQAEDGIRDAQESRGLGDVYKRQVMIITNEGNGRLSGSIPPVHIVLAGIEKLVPTYDLSLIHI